MKGESSGHTQTVKDIAFDCDGDTLLDPGGADRRGLPRGLSLLLFPLGRSPTAATRVTEPQFKRPRKFTARNERGRSCLLPAAATSPCWGCCLFGRGADFFSTWVATPNLVLEGNPLAKKMGWKLGALVNLALCLGLAFWPVTAMAVTTASLLVAAHNFHLGLADAFHGRGGLPAMVRGTRARKAACRFSLPACWAKPAPTGLVGAGLLYCAPEDSMAFAIGCGIVAYALIVLFYTALSLWRLRRHWG